MSELRLTPEFTRWLSSLRDERARARILIRLQRLEAGLPGNWKPVGEGVAEMRIDYGPGYRVYYCQRGPVLVIVLGGGSKKTQGRDIKAALALARTF